MARIKKNKNSWKASSILTRDKRHDKSFDGTTGPKRKKKNTKKWCKGVEGREHEPEWRWNHWNFSFTHRVGKKPYIKEIYCKKCGKVLKGWCTNWEEWNKDPKEISGL